MLMGRGTGQGREDNKPQDTATAPTKERATTVNLQFLEKLAQITMAGASKTSLIICFLLHFACPRLNSCDLWHWNF